MKAEELGENPRQPVGQRPHIRLKKFQTTAILVAQFLQALKSGANVPFFSPTTISETSSSSSFAKQ
jgi:hypothetical protein